MQVRRIAIIGYGKIAQDQHAPSISNTAGLELVATVSRRGEAPKGIPAFPNMEALAASGLAVDTVAFCTPPQGRIDDALKAIGYGWDVLLEKPPAASVSEAQVLAERAKASGRVVFTTWHSQYNAAVDEAVRQLAGEEITSLHIEWREDVRKWHPGQQWIWQAGGFGVLDPGINALSIATKIVPVALTIESAALEIAANHQSPIAVELKFGGDLKGIGTASFDWRQCDCETWQIHIETSRKRLRIDKGGSDLWIDDQLAVSAASAEYPLIYQRFSELLRSRQSVVDLAPLQLAADIFLLGHRHTLPPFEG